MINKLTSSSQEVHDVIRSNYIPQQLLYYMFYCFSLNKMLKWFQKKINKVEYDRPRTFNIFFGFFLMVNNALGTGFLSIPYVYFHGGILLEIVTMLFITFLSWLCAIWVIETMARSQVSHLS